MNARTADFAATAPWSGITGKPDHLADPITPSGRPDGALLAWSAADQRWVPLTLAQLKQRLDAL